MSNLLASLRTAAGAMKAYESALGVVQNNVTNSTTPGYARQQVDLIALAFQPDLELPGGVRAGELLNSRSTYAEQSVRQQTERHGRVSSTAAGLGQVEPIFDIAEGSGIAGAINRLYNAFSGLSVTPNNVTSRENVIGRAEDVARSFDFTATSLSRTAEHTNREIRTVVDKINRIGGKIRDLNVELRRDYRLLKDAGMEARLYSSLEELASLVDFNVIQQDDGSLTVLVGGQIPLVMGDRIFELQGDFSGAQVEIRDHEGTVVTSKIQQGSLAGLLDLVNIHIVSYETELNQLAESFADRINAVLAAGVDLNGLPGAALLTYDAVNGSARTLSVTGITQDQIAAALPATPGGNGNALNLTDLATSAEIGGFTFTEYYGQISTSVGHTLAAAREDERSQSLLLSQAKSLRDEVSGVDLNMEAANLIQYQQAYQAAAQIVSILDELTAVVLDLIR
jgi:flagellar hook-associated protein 1 FlgK